MAKNILGAIVHAVPQVVSQLDELGQDAEYEVSLDPILGFYSLGNSICGYLAMGFCVLSVEAG